MKALYTFLFAVGLSPFLHAQYILTLNLSQMDPYVGMPLKIRVTEIGSGWEVGRKSIDAVASASFSVELYVFLHGRNYNVDIVVDVNENGEYDAPPTDHAWRRTVMNTTMHRTINFIPDDVFADTGCPEAFPYSQYDAIWGGKWRNLTFGSTDTIKAAFSTTCDSVFGHFETAGVFGNPQTVMFDFAEEIPEGSDPGDTIVFSPGAPWTGEISIIEGRIEGDISMSGFQLLFSGTVGAKQVLCLYEVHVGGNPLATGYFYVRELNIISSAEELDIQVDAIQHVSCNGEQDGSVTLSAHGGTAPFVYSLNGGPLTFDPTFTGLPPGEYCGVVVDALGCTSEGCFTITEPEPLLVSLFSVDAGCNGTCDGQINLTISGGVPTYTFQWNTGSQEMTLLDVCAGEFQVTVSDANGCLTSAITTINEPDSLLITNVSIVDATDGEANGSITVTATGGITPFLYSLTGSAFQASPVFEQLPAGEYFVFVMDVNGCEVQSGPYTVQNISGVRELKTSFKLYPNPASSFVTIEADAPLSIQLTNLYGQSLMIFPDALTHHIDVKDVVPGIYIVRLSDRNGEAYRKVIID